MKKLIKPQDAEPNKILVDVFDEFINELYSKCNVDQDPKSIEDLKESQSTSREGISKS